MLSRIIGLNLCTSHKVFFPLSRCRDADARLDDQNFPLARLDDPSGRPLLRARDRGGDRARHDHGHNGRAHGHGGGHDGDGDGGDRRRQNRARS